MKNAITCMAIFALLNFNTESFAAPRTPSLCEAGERTIFSCQMEKKIVSLCGAPELSRTEGWLQYRYGKSKSNLELVFPQQRTHPRESFVLTTDDGSSAKSSSDQLAFKVGAFEYVVFTERAVFDWNGQGIVIFKNEKRQTYQECTGSAMDNMHELRNVGIPIEAWRNIYP